MSGPDVVTFGEAMALLLAEPGRPLEHAENFRRSVAGAEANTAVALARLGHRTAWFGRVGDDAFGRAVLRTLRGEGVDTSRARTDPEAPTGIIVRDCHASRAIEVLYHRAGSAGSRLGPGDLDLPYLTSARVLHLTGVTAALSPSALEACVAAADAARAAEVTVCLDPNVRLRLRPASEWPGLLAPLIERADVLLTGADEAGLLTGEREHRAAATALLGRGPGLVVLKDGARGASATDGDGHWTVPARPTAAPDPVGAGDAFNAGFLSARLRSLPVPKALAEAAVVAAHAVQVPGDLEGLPTARQRDAALTGTPDTVIR
ncbi:sugar kinase [Streptomyces sp. NPDC004609]|uniref:sugar kinase n=1 Tax=Streptomyces sp. NPDC004609 TaxID=3364704 RepID=UPI0036B4B8B2